MIGLLCGLNWKRVEAFSFWHVSTTKTDTLIFGEKKNIKYIIAPYPEAFTLITIYDSSSAHISPP